MTSLKPFWKQFIHRASTACGQRSHHEPICLLIKVWNKMMTTTEIILFVFGHVWLKWRQSCRSRSRRRRALAQMQWLNAFDNQQEEDPCEILICFAATGLFLSTLQWRSVWVRSRSQSFACIIKLWSDLEWKRNFQFSRATFQHFCSELRGCLQHSSTVCAAIPVIRE